MNTQPFKFLCLAGLLSCSSLYAQTFQITHDSTLPYDAKIVMDACESDHCEGVAHIDLIAPHHQQVVQSFISEDLSMFLQDGQPTHNVVQLYGEQSPLIMNDFNFDGSLDLAIRNGNNSGYGGPSYDVYVYQKRQKRFVPSAELNDLVLNNLGMFQVDQHRKRLITFSKSGCCWHLRTEYAVAPQQGLVEMAAVEEAVTTDGQFVEVTTRTRKGGLRGQMRSHRKRYPINTYYPPN
jgi:hypothetical protein